jgi:hypothetical protein
MVIVEAIARIDSSSNYVWLASKTELNSLAFNVSALASISPPGDCRSVALPSCSTSVYVIAKGKT